MIKDNFDRKKWRPIKINSLNLQSFISKNKSIQIIDQYDNFLEELFLLRHPKYRFQKVNLNELLNFKKIFLKKKKQINSGKWFYFPWNNLLIHYLPEKEHLELRTGRNRNLITNEEQKKFYHATILLLGMSVGSHVALTLSMMGGFKKMILADPDEISGSNLNRIRSGFSQVGMSKVKSVSQQIYEINPYAKITIYPKGLTEKNISKILNKTKKIDIIIDEMDSPYFKIKIREVAQTLKIPVIMAADNGDGVNVDVERYDLDKNNFILHNIIPNVKSSDFKKINPKDLPQIISKIAGAKYASSRMINSVKSVGKTLYSWPQLGTAATLCGSTLSNLSRRIILNENIKTGRYIVNEKKMFKKVI